MRDSSKRISCFSGFFLIKFGEFGGRCWELDCRLRKWAVVIFFERVVENLFGFRGLK